MNGLALSHGGNGGRFNGPELPAVYLADSEPTAWAEWYRWLAEWTRSPAEQLPRDLYRVTVKLTGVGDLRTMAAREWAAAPGRMRQTSAQWPPFQQVGARLAAEGAQGICMRPRPAPARCACARRPWSDCASSASRVTVIDPPPPRGLRT